MEITDNEIIAQLKREPAEELRRLQRMPYDWKVEHALDVIREFFEHEGESGVYVSFSGGKDSLIAKPRKSQIWERCKKAEADASETQAYVQEPENPHRHGSSRMGRRAEQAILCDYVGRGPRNR